MIINKQYIKLFDKNNKYNKRIVKSEKTKENLIVICVAYVYRHKQYITPIKNGIPDNKMLKKLY